jgi:hypothetical protein
MPEINEKQVEGVTLNKKGPYGALLVACLTY